MPNRSHTPRARTPRERTPFGARMYEARTRAGLTQNLVCAALGVTQGTISVLESSGQGSRLVAEFAKAYGVNPIWLATGEGSPGWQEDGGDTSERHSSRLVAEEDWALLQDVKLVLDSEELDAISHRASRMRERLDVLLRQRLAAAANERPASNEPRHQQTRGLDILPADEGVVAEQKLGGSSAFGRLDEESASPSHRTQRLRRHK